jgi:hypothetical protein
VNVSEMMKVKLESSLESSIINLIATDYSTIAGNKPRQMLARDIVNLVNVQFQNLDKVEVGQALWMGVDAKDRPSYGKNAYNTHLVPIVLTLLSREDIDLRIQGYSAREVRENRIVRLFREAYEQGALLTNSDVGALLGVSPSTVSKQAREFMERENIILPTRGTVHDLGMSTTHKRIIIRLYLQGYITSEIARITDHSEEAVDRYIRAFEKVRLLSDKSLDYIHKATGMSKWLIEAYLEILRENEDEEDKKNE